MTSCPPDRQHNRESLIAWTGGGGTDAGPPPKAITSGTYLQRVAFAEQFLEGDITSSGLVGLVQGCNRDKPGLYLGEQQLFKGGEGGEDDGTHPPNYVHGAAWTDRTLLATSWEMRSFAACF